MRSEGHPETHVPMPEVYPTSPVVGAGLGSAGSFASDSGRTSERHTRHQEAWIAPPPQQIQDREAPATTTPSLQSLHRRREERDSPRAELHHAAAAGLRHLHQLCEELFQSPLAGSPGSTAGSQQSTEVFQTPQTAIRVSLGTPRGTTVLGADAIVTAEPVTQEQVATARTDSSSSQPETAGRQCGSTEGQGTTPKFGTRCVFQPPHRQERPAERRGHSQEARARFRGGSGATGRSSSALRASSAERNARRGQPGRATSADRSRVRGHGTDVDGYIKAHQSASGSIGVCSTATGGSPDVSPTGSPPRSWTPRGQALLHDAPGTLPSTPRRPHSAPRVSRWGRGGGVASASRAAERRRQIEQQEPEGDPSGPPCSGHQQCHRPHALSEFGHERRAGAPFVLTTPRCHSPSRPSPVPGPGSYRPPETWGDYKQTRTPSLPKSDRRTLEGFSSTVVTQAISTVPFLSQEHVGRGPRFSGAPRTTFQCYRPGEVKEAGEKPGPGAYAPRYRCSSRFK